MNQFPKPFRMERASLCNVTWTAFITLATGHKYRTVGLVDSVWYGWTVGWIPAEVYEPGLKPEVRVLTEDMGVPLNRTVGSVHINTGHIYGEPTGMFPKYIEAQVSPRKMPGGTCDYLDVVFYAELISIDRSREDDY